MSDSKAAGFEEKGFREKTAVRKYFSIVMTSKYRMTMYTVFQCYTQHEHITRGQNSVKKSEFCPLVVEVKMEYNNDVSE